MRKQWRQANTCLLYTSDTKSVVAAAEKAGYTDIYKTELISLTEFEKLMVKKKFKEILGEYVVKPPGKLALVPNSDPREAVNLETAEDAFTPLDLSLIHI